MPSKVVRKAVSASRRRGVHRMLRRQKKQHDVVVATLAPQK